MRGLSARVRVMLGRAVLWGWGCPTGPLLAVSGLVHTRPIWGQCGVGSLVLGLTGMRAPSPGGYRELILRSLVFGGWREEPSHPPTRNQAAAETQAPGWGQLAGPGQARA